MKTLLGISFFAAACVVFACGGKTSDGGNHCNTDQDCDAGTCVYAERTCPGTCLPYRKEGETCGPNVAPEGECFLDGKQTPCGAPFLGECIPDSGLSCDPDGHDCVLGSHVVIGQDGDLCNTVYDRCDAHLYCTADKRCSPILQNGEPCVVAVPGCDEGLVCPGDSSDGGTSTCQPAATVGGSCLMENTSGASGCTFPLQCIDGKCAPPPASGPCINRTCQADVAYCDFSTSSCQPLRADGAPCTDFYQCLHQLCDLTGHCGTTLCPN